MFKLNEWHVSSFYFIHGIKSQFSHIVSACTEPHVSVLTESVPVSFNLKTDRILLVRPTKDMVIGVMHKRKNLLKRSHVYHRYDSPFKWFVHKQNTNNWLVEWSLNLTAHFHFILPLAVNSYCVNKLLHYSLLVFLFFFFLFILISQQTFPPCKRTRRYAGLPNGEINPEICWRKVQKDSFADSFNWMFNHSLVVVVVVLFLYAFFFYF